MNKLAKILCLGIAAGAIVAAPVYAKDNEKGNGRESKGSKQLSIPKKPHKIRMALKPLLLAPADLAGARGSIDGMVGKNKTELRALVRVPVPAASLLISDLATAKAAAIRMEIWHNDQLINDCKLAFNNGDDDLTATMVKFRLHAKDRGKKFVKGECVNGLPILWPKDKVLIYGIVNNTRVDFLGSPAALLPTPEPTVIPPVNATPGQ